MNQELIKIYANHLQNLKTINSNNEYFFRAILLLYNINLCRTCASSINNYYSLLKKQFDNRIKEGLNLNDYIDKPIETKSFENEEIINNVEITYEDDIIQKYIPKAKTKKTKKTK